LSEEDTAEKDSLIGMLGINAVNLQDTLVHLNEVVDVHASGKQRLKILNLAKEIEKTTGVLSGSLKAAAAKLSIEVSPEIEFEFDPAYLESILLNLLTNAIKYRNPEKLLEININANKLKDQIILRFKDNGMGIDMVQNGNKLFGMYKTFHGNDDARGIGLFLVKNQVEAMGGNITAESIPGNGTTFIIEFRNQMA
jgi:signal transduction histidine kinase